MSRLVAALLLALVLGVFAFRAPASADELGQSALRIERAYQGKDGKLLVSFAFDSTHFPAHNTLFFGNPNHLTQVESGWLGSNANDSWKIFEKGAVLIEGSRATLRCGSRDQALSALSLSETLDLESRIRSGALALEWLPTSQEPAFLLKVGAENEWVYVTEPRYDFHQNFRVYLGKPGAWKEIPTIANVTDSTWNQAGLIRFKNGGGVYIPAAIDLFHDTSKHRGAPMLIRHSGARPENLVRANPGPETLRALGLSRRALPATGLKTREPASVRTPCAN